MKIALLWIVPLVLVQSCSNDNGKIGVELRDTSGGIDSHEVPTTTHTSAVTRLDVCDLLAGFPNNVDSIIAYPRSLNSLQDSCTLTLLDSLVDRFISTKDVQYIVALDSVAEVSDGYVSEYLETLSVSLYRQALPSYVSYLEKLDSNQEMIRFLRIGLQYEVKNFTDSIARFNSLVSIAEKSRMTHPQREFINKILMNVKWKLDRGEE